MKDTVGPHCAVVTMAFAVVITCVSDTKKGMQSTCLRRSIDPINSFCFGILQLFALPVQSQVLTHNLRSSNF